MSLVLASLLYIASEGLLGLVWEKDITKLSFLLLAIFSAMSGWCGYKTWTLSKFLDNGQTEDYLVEKIEHLDGSRVVHQ